MEPHYLSKLFNPTSIAVFGASDRPESVGGTAFQNLLTAGFTGNIYPINPKHAQVQGQACYPSLEAIDNEIDVAVIATPAHSIQSILHACGQAKIPFAIILSAGFESEEGKQLKQTVLKTARHYNMRLVGPNCLGIMRPKIGLNATFSKNQAQPGKLALVSQSGALCTGVLDWAESNEIGFSLVASTGDAADLDFGEILDYLAVDAQTHSILLYIEGIVNARKFLSGLRKAARMKPVILLKSGRMPEGTQAAISHTGALVGGDDIFNAAIERAGVVRAKTISQLFAAAKTLSYDLTIKRKRLVIVTNGGGPGVMATDLAAELGIKMPQVSEETQAKLNEFLPEHWSHNNPIDILGDATPERYRKAIEVCLEDDAFDAVLVLLTPQAMTDPVAIAESLVELSKQGKHKKPLLTAWLGDNLVGPAREAFTKAHIPTFRTPEAAVEAMHFVTEYHHNQTLLQQVPEPNKHGHFDIDGARRIIHNALHDNRTLLNTLETKALLKAFQIPVTQAMIANTPAEVLVAAENIGFPVAIKVHSDLITHKSDSGGVKLNIETPSQLQRAYNELIESVKEHYPNDDIRSVSIEPMMRMSHARELIIGVSRDPVFGPAISFGSGGTMVEILKDSSSALPPLNAFIAQRMIQSTKVSKMLGNYRNLPAVDQSQLIDILMNLSDMVSELPEILELDLNPVLANEEQTLAVDARIRVQRVASSQAPYSHMAIHPYPTHLESHFTSASGLDIWIRPIRAEDAELETEFVSNLSEHTKFLRFMQSVKNLSKEMLVRFTQIDYDQEMAFIAYTEEHGKTVELGVTRYSTNPDGKSCEFALVVRDDYQHQGIGSQLLESLIEHARNKGLKRMTGEVLKQNQSMLQLVSQFDFQLLPCEDDPGIMIVEKAL
ncbi:MULTISPECIES: bifunctional acetate--CoA ligase family protein/GNAT family N-acetyltransferase [Thiomicrorhabdus]|uniref:Bifunctional acetate--CoA ligase family protein/GNAT family N-acetyltransferase n=1 Tax=Thiomicrorhabdus heinhorstiae TaxID=2748010 RepID=A0ABS0BVL6_9GAMM|nr:MULTISPECIES: bifunctional acetate--CoA ligase family protein/GNAT family N-acetyltransferase [Thiomicrorhabdus]MBF6057113.1 bifunctional acetate--CoA ligase family protein/GNAT family N-acetyltransferase [Thiomicrorhabdus heinhorstiae]